MTDNANLDELLSAVADPRRRALFDRISRSDGITVVDLTAGSGVTQGAVSQHLKILKNAGLVIGEPQGRHVIYRARPGGLAPFVGWLAAYENFWPSRIAAMRELLKEIEE